MNLPFDIREALVEIGQHSDQALDLAETALILATVDRPAVHLDRYRRHLEKISEEVGAYVAGLPTPLDVSVCHEALVQVIFRRYGYIGGEDSFDDAEAANLTHVIDRRSGLPVVLGIIYIHAARQQGWGAEGLNFPGRFLLRLEINSERLILDPFAGGAAVGTSDLRDILKALSGAHAELEPAHYEPVTAREILLRVQNNIRNRLLRSDRVEDAIEVIETMLLFAPKATYLWRECGMLYARIDQVAKAITSLETYLKYDRGVDSRYNASMLLQELRQRLN